MSNINTQTYTMNFGTLTAPTITPAGGTSTGAVTVTLSAPPPALIRYTLDGSTPSLNSPLYTGPFPVVNSGTLRARSFHPDYTASTTTAQTYTVIGSTPTFSLPSGTYPPGTAITISADAGSTVRWTLDGSDPTASSPILPASPILLGPYTIKVRAFRSTAGDSAVASATYALTEPLGSGSVSVGGDHVLLATPEGMLYGWGYNNNSQVGDGAATNRSTPVLVQTLTGVIGVAGGDLHSLAVTADGAAWGWGYNWWGVVGVGTVGGHYSRPVRVTGIANAIAVAAGYTHSLVLTSAGEVYAFGKGGEGQLGQGTTPTSSGTPLLVPGLTNVVAIAAGGNYSLAVTASGQVWAWGANANSQLGDGTTTPRLVPTLVPGLANVAAVAAGSLHSMALTRSGALWSWGEGANGRLGLGSTTTQASPVLVSGVAGAVFDAGASHSGLLSTTGTLLGWGLNNQGRVGVGSTPTSVLSPTAVSGLSGVTALALGDANSVAVTLDGGVWTWGAGGPALGDGTTGTRSTPAQAWTAPGRWSPPPPMLSVPAGTYTSEQIVLVTSAVPGATLRYTTNGMDPTESDPEVPAGGDVLIAGTTTLKARAWVPGRAPSVVAAATYTLQPAAPTLTPATGMYVGAQTVTLSTADSLATIRYTLDGMTPSDTSTPYVGPFVVASTATVQAGAFRSGWTPSAVTSATLTIVQGILTTPTMSPAGGIYQPTVPVTLSGPAGATIRYTTDGNEPTGVSNVYVGPIAFPAGAVTLKAKAFQTDWGPSATATGSYTFDGTPPTITAIASPPPNAAGWNMGPVTVSFVCSDNVATASCTGPATVTAAGATAITGTATDAAGHQSTASVTVQLDVVPPVVALASPTGDVTTTDTSITLTGTVSDGESGLTLVQCNGQDAAVDQGNATCTVALQPGRNAIVLLARDAAGHSTSRGIRVTRTGTSTTLTLMPETRTLLVNEAATLSLLDDFGATIGAATWASSDPAIVALSTDDPPVLTALAAGAAMITATKNGLSATATITVMAGTTLADGTTRWTVPAASGTTLGTTIYTHRVAEEVPDLFVTEKAGTGTYAASYTVKAAMGDGTVRWSEAVPGVPVFGDEQGGLVVALGSDDVTANYISGLARVAGPDSAVPWRYTSPGWLATGWVAGGYPAPEHPEVAQGPDGTIFVAELPGEGWRKYMLGLDGATGDVKFRVPLPRSRRAHFYLDGTFYDYEVQTFVTPPVIGEDGAAYVQALSWQDIETQTGPGEGEDYEREDVTLVRVTPTGEMTQTVLWSHEGINEWPKPTALPVAVVPDGVGGVLAQWVFYEPPPTGPGPGPGHGRVTRVVGSTTTEFSLSSASEEIALVGEASTMYVVEPSSGSARAVDALTGQTKWIAPVAGTPILARPGGGVAIRDGDGTIHGLGGNGALETAAEVPVSDPVAHVEYGTWIGVSATTVVAVEGPAFEEPTFAFWSAKVGGNPTRQMYGKKFPRFGIFAKGHPVLTSPFRHVAIRIVPTNQLHWLQRDAQLPEAERLFTQRNEREDAFMTIGAGPHSPGCTGTLESAPNRYNDVRLPPNNLELLWYPIQQEDILIQALIDRDSYYDDNSLQYWCFPEGNPGYYNSNGYAHGLLNAVQLSEPAFVYKHWLRYRGWWTPVPTSAFVQD